MRIKALEKTILPEQAYFFMESILMDTQSHSVDSSASPKTKILIVDDSVENSTSLSEEMKWQGYETQVAGNGMRALELVKVDLPDVILMDVMMPKLGGFETCIQLKADEETRDIPVIFMTGLTSVEDKVKAFEVGGVDYVVKPVQIAEMLARVRTHLALRKMQKQLSTQNEQLHQEIAERKQIEGELRRVHANLAVANQELEAFSYSVSHDLRAPLRVISSYGQVLLDGFSHQLDEGGQKHLGVIQNATRRMTQLIDDLLKLSRISRREMRCEWVNLSEYVNTIAEDLKKSTPERQVEFQIAQDVTGKGDPGLLRIVLENLLGNAWKFTGKHTPGYIEFGVIMNDGKSAYYVRDNGAGFDMEYANKLFTPFQRLHTETEFEGTGIGLATVQRIVHRHGGQVWVDAVVEQGATFFFTLS
jgi:two-component system, sensor histidine kinase and response regulator